MSERSPGFEEYTPSRLEWLSVMLNSHLPFLSVPDIEYVFVPGPEGKSLKLRVIHSEEMDIEQVNTVIDQIKKYALGITKVYKWDSWLEIQVEISSVDDL